MRNVFPIFSAAGRCWTVLDWSGICSCGPRGLPSTSGVSMESQEISRATWHGSDQNLSIQFHVGVNRSIIVIPNEFWTNVIFMVSNEWWNGLVDSHAPMKHVLLVIIGDSTTCYLKMSIVGKAPFTNGTGPLIKVVSEDCRQTSWESTDILMCAICGAV